MTQVLNQFSQSVEQGMMDLSRAVNTISVQIDTTSAGGLVAGQAVKLVDSAGGIPKVVECAADTDEVFGFLTYNIKDATYDAGDRTEICTGYDDVMYMKAGAAVARGAKIMVVIATKKVLTATVGKSVIGWAFDKAAADLDLIRVVVQLPSRSSGVIAANVAALAGTLTGTVDGTINDVAAAACAGGAEPTAAQVDTAVAALALSTNLALKELQTTLNAEIAALKAAKLQASS